MVSRRLSAMAGVLLGLSAPAGAQVSPCSAVETSPNLPPAGSPPLVRCYELRFHPSEAQIVDTKTYLYHISSVLRPSLRSENKWVAFNKNDALAAFSQLWRTNFLDNLWLEVIEEPYENGVIGKHLVFHLEERLPVKFVGFIGSNEVESAKIEDALRKAFPDISGLMPDENVLIRQARKAMLDLYAEQGFPNATVEIRKAPIPGLRVAGITFVIKEGPRTKREMRIFTDR